MGLKLVYNADDVRIQRVAKTIERIIETAGSGHYATSMSCLPILYHLMVTKKVLPSRIILSKGHGVPALYAMLYHLDYLSEDEIMSFRKKEGLPGHPESWVPGIAASSGSLGMGISKACGMAKANPNVEYHVIVGDGELQEGQNWEALQYMIANNIQNVFVHIDANCQQYSGRCKRGLMLSLPSRVPNVHIWNTEWKMDNKYLTSEVSGWANYKDNLAEYNRELIEVMENPLYVVLCADLEQDFGLTEIKEKYPDRYVETGISEQHMISMANGLAMLGKIPICHTFGAFYRRAVDQMYNNGCDHLKVLYVAGLCGEFPVNIGKSHESTPGVGFTSIVPYLKMVNNIEEFKKLPPVCSGYMEIEI